METKLRIAKKKVRTLLYENDEKKKEIAEFIYGKKIELMNLRLLIEQHKIDAMNEKLKPVDLNKGMELIDKLVNELMLASYSICPVLSNSNGLFDRLKIYYEKQRNNSVSIVIEEMTNELKFSDQVDICIYNSIINVVDYLSSLGNSKIAIGYNIIKKNIFSVKITTDISGKYNGRAESKADQLDLIKTRLFYLDANISKNSNWEDFVCLSFKIQ